MRKLTALFVALVMLMLLTACGTQPVTTTAAPTTAATTAATVTEAPVEPSAGETVRIALVTKMVDSPYWQTVKAAAEARAAELGNVEVVHLGPPTEADIDRQVQIIETCINDDYDGIVLAACDVDALVAPVEQAKAAGIPVVMIDSGISEPVYDAFLSTNNVQAGAECAKLMVELIGDAGEVGIIGHAAGTQTAVDRIKGFTDELTNNHPNIEIVGVQYCDSDPTRAANQATDMIAANPNLKGMWGSNDQSAVGIVQAVTEQDKTDTISIIGFDNSDDIKAALANKTLSGTAVQMPSAMGSRGVDLILDLLAGNPPASKDVDTGVTMVNQENISDPDIQSILNQ